MTYYTCDIRHIYGVPVVEELHTHTYIHIYIYIYTHIHTYTHIYTYTYVPVVEELHCQESEVLKHLCYDRVIL
jgi:hypothetical protein